MPQRHHAKLTAAILCTAAVVAACSGRGAPRPAAAPGEDRIVRAERPVPEQYLVALAPGSGDAEAVARDLVARHGGTLLRVYAHALRGLSVHASAASAGAMALDPRVARVEQDAEAEAAAVAWQAAAPWNLDRVDQRAAALDGRYGWNSDWAGQGVDAFVLDTGVLASHVQFQYRASFAYDALGEGATGDCSGHGTHVAGTLGGRDYGVAKGVRIRSVRVLDCNGNGKVSDVVAGLDWVIANHPNPSVVNLSLFSGPSQALDDAVEAAVAAGIPVVVAAGDGGRDACTVSPARTPGAITVAAMEQEAPATPDADPRDVLAPYSNVGDCVDVVAPGTNVVSAWSTTPVADLALSGTSMAAPHVAGAIALYLSRYPSATPEAIARAVVANAGRAPLGAPWFTPDRLLYSRFVEYPRTIDEAAPVAAITWPAADAALSGAVTVTADASDDQAVTRVELLVDGRWRATADVAPYALAWDTTTALDGAHALVVRAYDAAGNATDSAAVTVTVSNPGVAHLDAALAVPRCESPATSCDTRDLVRGRGALGPERSAPNALREACDADPAGCACQDGPTGAYRVDESVERIRVTGAEATPLATGGNVRIDVDVFVGADLGDFLDLWVSPAVGPPAWRPVITLEPVASGAQTLTAWYTLPAGTPQAVRAAFRHGGEAATCTAGGYDDRDDVVFEVGPGAEDVTGPTVQIVAPSDGAALAGTTDVEVDAHDDRLVSKVVLSAVDAAGKAWPVAQLTAAPYQTAWKAALLQNGTYTLRAEATDGAGHAATDAITVEIADHDGPVCAVTSPASGAVLDSNLLRVVASAEDAGAVKKLELLVDGVPYDADAYAPWGFEVRLPANGDYAVKVRGTDLQGNVGESAPVSVRVADAKGPELKAVSPTDGATVTGVVTFEVEAKDPSGVARVDLYRDGELRGSATGAPYQITWDADRAQNGAHVFEARAWDGVGNEASLKVTVQRDDQAPPTVTLTAPLPDEALAGDVELAADAADDSAVERVEFWLFDPAAGSSRLLGTDRDAPYTYTWATGSVAAGSWELRATAYDYAGNAATSDPAVPVTTGDLTPPTTTLRAPRAGLPPVSGTIRVAADAADPGGQVAKVELRVDGTAFATLTAAPYEAVLDTTAVPNGDRMLTSRAFDLAGNASAESAPVTITVSNPGAILDPLLGVPACDGLRPLCHTGLLVMGRGPLGPEANAPNAIDGCPDGEQGAYGVDESIEHVAIRSVDGGNLAAGRLARIDVRAVVADPAYDRLDVWAAADPAAPEFVRLATIEPSAAGDQLLTATVPLLGSERQVIRVSLRAGGPAEACGTTGYDDRDDVVIAVEPPVPDVTAPVVEITSPAADTAVSGPVTVVAAASDDVGVTRVELLVDGVTFAEASSAPYEATWDPAGLAPGTYALSARAFDLAGNVGESAPVPVVVKDVVAPSCRITTPVNDDTVNATVSVQAEASDDVGVVSVELLRVDPDGTVTSVGTDASAPYAFALPITALQDGAAYGLVARARDAGGNATDSARVTLHVAKSGLAAWDRTLKAPKCGVAGIQCWTGGLVVGRGPLGPESKAPNTLASSCADGTSGFFHLDESAEAIAVRAVDPAAGLKAGAAVRIEVKVWATASYPTDRLDVFVAADAKAPTWILLKTLTPTHSGAEVLAVDHVLGAGTLQAVRAQLRHGGAPSGGCSTGELDDRDDLAFAVAK